MRTKWGNALDPNQILPEYPRPQFRRNNCMILNGKWEYAITGATQQTPPDRFDGTILVPFSPESELSGVGRTLKPNECLWYRRTLEAPDGFDANTEDLILHFGAVDQFAEVRLNGVTISHHAGGYLPFSIVLSEAFVNGIPNELLVRVRDESDTSCWSRGKQSSKPGGIWYTPQSGIWQTVWLEPVPVKYIAGIRTTPDIDRKTLRVEVDAAAAQVSDMVEVTVLDGGKEIARAKAVNGVPAIINSRTMLPVRFVSENIGADVDWEDLTRTVTIRVTVSSTLGGTALQPFGRSAGPAA